MTCKCDLNDKLEAERYDVSFREPKTPTRCKREHVTEKQIEERDKLMFNAGRYAAGARDKVATAANTKLFEGFTK